jgi:hypothetical protein
MTKAKAPPALGEPITISPAADRRVRHPDGRVLEAGTEVDWSTYWQRRLDDEDVELGDTTPVGQEKTK